MKKWYLLVIIIFVFYIYIFLIKLTFIFFKKIEITYFIYKTSIHMHWKINEVLLYELYKYICVCVDVVSLNHLILYYIIERQTSSIFLIYITLFFYKIWKNKNKIKKVIEILNKLEKTSKIKLKNNNRKILN